jgi:hypothetical protein
MLCSHRRKGQSLSAWIVLTVRRELVVFIGLAAPIETPLIGPPERP